MHVHPPPPSVHPPPGHVHPPPPPERLVMRQDEAVGNKKKMLVSLPKHNYKLDNNLLTVEPRAVYPHCFDAAPDYVIADLQKVRISLLDVDCPDEAWPAVT
jgi:hypothetical protein